jgi:excisionase family DNA binding protein
MCELKRSRDQIYQTGRGPRMTQMTGNKEIRLCKFLTVPDVAEELNLSVRKVWDDIRKGLLKTHKFGRSTRISRKDLDNYIRRSR